MSLKFSDAVRDSYIPLNDFAGRLTAFLRKLSGKKTRVPVKVIGGAAVFLLLFWLVLRFSPYADLKSFLARPNSVRYSDRNGILLQVTPLDGGLRREWSSEIPAHVKDVFVFAEDRRFYSHAGVDLFSLARAFYQNVSRGRRVSGASTISMQTARIISEQAGRRQTLGRKAGEVFNAFRLEARFSKDEILNLYLNSLPFGFNTEGVTSAALTFFAADISMLSPSQVFCLAVIPRRPSLYNPLENPEACVAAALELQEKFASNKKLKTSWPLLAQVDENDWKFAAASARRFEYPFELPHLIRNMNAGYNGYNVSQGNKVFADTITSKNEVRLSIDIYLQKYLEAAVFGNVQQNYSSRLTNGSAIVIDNETGEILAWVGSADFFNAGNAGQIDGVLALNQPGSSMKPFLYAMALEKGFLPTDVLADIQMSFGEDVIYIPRNFNDRFNGPILFRAALASSLNIPAVYLLYRLGVQNYIGLLESLGFDSLEHSSQDAGLGLALGNAPVSLLELVRAFSVFPRDGLYLPLSLELQTTPAAREQKRVYSADTSRIICSFLSDSGARVLAFGSGRNFATTFPAIFKTGTANQYQSIVALGATPRFTAGVWMGNFTGETVMGRTGSSVPAAIARDVLNVLENAYGSNTGNYEFAEPENWITRRICALSGMAPSDACYSVVNEYVRHDKEIESCTWHQTVNGRSETIFPAEYQAWFNSAERQGILDYSSRPLEILTPRSGFVYLNSPGIGINEIPVEIIGGADDELHVTHNGSGFTVKRPFAFYLPKTPGINTLVVKNGDEQDEVSFVVEN